MRQLADGTKVSVSGYNLVLDFNNQDNWKTIKNLYGVSRIEHLSKHQYVYLFKHVVGQEVNELEKV
jgi:hypothetical protein